MKNIKLTAVLLMLLIPVGVLRLDGQNAPSAKVEFLSAPVLFKEGNKSFQQVVASYSSENPGKIVFARDGKEILKADLRKGMNRFLLTVPSVTKPKKSDFSVRIDDGTDQTYAVTLLPPKKWEIYFVQHSHTDIGYTRPQSEILAEHMRYIDYALDYCDQTDGLPDDAKFRWTCESSWVTREYLRSRPSVQIERFKRESLKVVSK